MPTSRRSDLLKEVERAIVAAAHVASVLRQIEPAQDTTATIRARFSAAVRNLIALRRRAHALGKKHQDAVGMMRAIDNARADLERAFLSDEAHQLLGTKPKPMQRWPKPLPPGNGSVRTVSGGLPSLGRRR
jgi:Skp family chaperone for outer membrane proteins